MFTFDLYILFDFAKEKHDYTMKKRQKYDKLFKIYDSYI